MALNGAQPFIKVTDSNGLPIVGAKLYVYTVGTTTLKSIYSDDGLSAAITNPLSGVNASNASGDFPRFYLAAGTYKLRAETAAGVLIWEYDNIDTGLSAGTGALPISAGGTGATTAAGARTNLGVPASSELTDLASDIADIQTQIANIVSQPQGRLTPTSGAAIITSNVIAGTAVYYTPHIGNQCPVWDGVQFNLKTFAELTLTLVSNHLSGAVYDVYLIDDGGTIRIVTGPAFNTVTPGAGARGSGAGTSELTRINGILVNANSMTGRYGSTTVAVDANKATFLGSIWIDASAGQITCHVAYGQARKWSVSNYYNRNPIILRVGTSTASWTNTPTTWRQSFADANNYGSLFSCFAEEVADIEFLQNILVTAAAGNTTESNIGVGLNVTNALTGLMGRVRTSLSGGTSTSNISTAKASAIIPPFLGINTINMIEQAPSGTTNNNFQGNSEIDNVMLLKWRG